MSSVIKAANVLALTPGTDAGEWCAGEHSVPDNGAATRPGSYAGDEHNLVRDRVRLVGATALLAATFLSMAPLQFIAGRRIEHDLEQAREEAQGLVKAAETERDAVWERARLAGREIGMAEGREAGAEAVRREANKRLQLLATVVDDLVRTRDQVVAQHEAEIVELALAVAARIVRRDNSLGADTVRNLLQEMLPRTLGARTVKVILHPRDLVELEGELQSLATLTEGRARVSWVSDDRIDSGGCVVETERGGIDGTLAVRAARIVESLLDVIVGGG